MSKKAIVTGGAGFIGSHVVKLLVEEGVDVRVFDSLITGKAERVPANVPLIKGDIRDRKVLFAAMQGATHVVHLAALVSVPESMTDPITTHEINVTGMENVLSAMRAAGIQRIVYATSAAVYGNEPSLPKSESSPLVPQSPYALSKVLNEAQADTYERAFGLSPVGLRFFNVYGPGQAGNHAYASVVPRWVESIRAGKGITIYGDGSQTRDFIHVSDIARAVYRALMADTTGVFNIASGQEVSLLQLVQIFEKAGSETFDVRHEQARAGDIRRSVADISAAKRVLDFTPTVGLEAGIIGLLQ